MIHKTETLEDLSISVPITQEERGIAKQFANQQPTPQKAEQVYYNTLAVCSVNNYLRIMGILTDLGASDSWNPTVRLFYDVADLAVTGVGQLECRPLHRIEPGVEVVQKSNSNMRSQFIGAEPTSSPKPTPPVCYIPSEVQDDRIGYVVVQIDDKQQEAALLGFTEKVETEELPISQLRSLKDLLKHIHQLKQAQSVKEPINLSQWLHNVFEVGWERVEAMFEPPQAKPACYFRTASQVETSEPKSPTDGVKRRKILDLEQVGESVALLVGLTPTASPKMGISVEVYPNGGQIYLPQELQVMLMDEEGKAVIQTEARSTKNIQWRFKVEPGDRFSIKVVLGDVSITELFSI